MERPGSSSSGGSSHFCPEGRGWFLAPCFCVLEYEGIWHILYILPSFSTLNCFSVIIDYESIFHAAWRALGVRRSYWSSRSSMARVDNTDKPWETMIDHHLNCWNRSRSSMRRLARPQVICRTSQEVQLQPFTWSSCLQLKKRSDKIDVPSWFGLFFTRSNFGYWWLNMPEPPTKDTLYINLYDIHIYIYNII